MATKIKMENPQTGETVTGFYGYSWTTFPALFRKDFITFIGGFIVLVIFAVFPLGVVTYIIGMFIWSFMYNKYYTTNLLRKGFVFAGNHTENVLAAGRLGVKLNANNSLTVSN